MTDVLFSLSSKEVINLQFEVFPGHIGLYR